MINSFSLAVVGADYPNRRGPGRRFEIALCAPGEPIDLIPEPNNPADPRAVAVFSARGVQIGYVTAERCGWISGMLGAGREVRAIFQQRTSYGAAIRIAFDGEEPTLPAAIAESPPAQGHDDSGFWPDDIPPDD
ncbi:HIRAN domain-containing protein [Sphingomonas laterariae]|uniref:HIRAN domain-containing protein n=1 Tax=Edaphosphingomonas laterariae TaxID=861865 RepID=A0A239JHK7_9SPHN|nr:HIRAN domain-containing protein [Sphingomonas laterariae]SNT05391.1 HIRAN domain-containing protein [Sphingomonas laterariae]